MGVVLSPLNTVYDLLYNGHNNAMADPVQMYFIWPVSAWIAHSIPTPAQDPAERPPGEAPAAQPAAAATEAAAGGAHEGTAGKANPNLSSKTCSILQFASFP